MTINVGDKVKVIPRSYLDLAKAGFNQKNAWDASDPNKNERVMLGATYRVLSIDQNSSAFGGRSVLFYKVLSKGGFNKVIEFDVLPADQVKLCPFKIGDKVLYRPKCSEQDLQYLNIFSGSYHFDDPHKLHEVTDVLNDYYIFIDFKKNDAFAFPFRWIDFDLARS